LLFKYSPEQAKETYSTTFNAEPDREPPTNTKSHPAFINDKEERGLKEN
jgi:hypothetical protein